MQVYGPHASVLYTRRAALTHSLSSLAHHFLAPAVAAKPYKLQPGGPGYEIVWGCTAVPPYLRALGDGNLEEAFARIARHEQTLLAPLLAFLRSKSARGVRIVGAEHEGLDRVPTVSFVVVGERAIRSQDVVARFDAKGNVSVVAASDWSTRVDMVTVYLQIGIRYGHFYAYTLVSSLSPSLDVEDGVVRISLVHYNTLEEVVKIIEVLEEILA